MEWNEKVSDGHVVVGVGMFLSSSCVRVVVSSYCVPGVVCFFIIQIWISCQNSKIQKRAIIGPLLAAPRPRVSL